MSKKNKKPTKYELFQKALPKQTYFNNWEQDKLIGLTEDLKDRIYERYQIKCAVFQRDNFKCQNVDCRSPHSDITIHHIKWQKNGGQDSVNNCITICDDCHKGYHSAAIDLRFSKSSIVPKKVRGQTLKLSKSDEIDWKKLKKQMRKFRRTVIPTLQNVDEQDLYRILKYFFDEVFRPE